MNLSKNRRDKLFQAASFLGILNALLPSRGALLHLSLDLLWGRTLLKIQVRISNTFTGPKECLQAARKAV
jgi:hypothetical protein